MAYSLYDAAVTPCAQQLGALAGIIDKAAAHCAANKIEESALLQDRLYPDMFCLARQIRQSADFAMNTGGRLAGVTPPTMPAVDDTSFAAAILLQKSPRGICKIETRSTIEPGRMDHLWISVAHARPTLSVARPDAQNLFATVSATSRHYGVTSQTPLG